MDKVFEKIHQEYDSKIRDSKLLKTQGKKVVEELIYDMKKDLADGLRYLPSVFQLHEDNYEYELSINGTIMKIEISDEKIVLYKNGVFYIDFVVDEDLIISFTEECITFNKIELKHIVRRIFNND